MAKMKNKVHYDEGADTLYFHFGNDNEPVYSEDIDNGVMVEIGWFSGMPKGFRVLGFKESRINPISLVKTAFEEIKRIYQERIEELQQREHREIDGYEENLPNMLAGIA
jgi:hypothetical protein